VYTPASGPLKSFDLAVFLGDTKKASGGLDAVSSGAKKVADGLQGFSKRQKDAQGNDLKHALGKPLFVSDVANHMIQNGMDPGVMDLIGGFAKVAGVISAVAGGGVNSVASR
jgi:hypothetical protein